MQAGFLVIKTDAGNDEVLLVSKSDDMPEIDPAATEKVIWVGRFDDIDAAQMHAHGYYCRELLDIDKGSYNISKGRAIAAIEGDKLLQETVFIDPELSADDQADRSNWVLYYKKRKQRFNAVILALKVVSVGFLLFILVMSF